MSRIETPRLQQLVYVSEDPRGITSVMQTADILEQARRNNARDDVTGALAFGKGKFIQILEGPSDKLDGLLQRLDDDLRHENLRVLVRREAVRRDFEGWSMVSPRLAPTELGALLDLTEDRGASLDQYIQALSEAVTRQTDIIAQNGFASREG